MRLQGTEPSTTRKPDSPRLTFSKEQADKFDKRIQVMMDFHDDDMRRIREQLLQRNGKVDMLDFVRLAQSHACAEDPAAHKEYFIFH